MSGMLNIPSSNQDPNYRYRMPRLVSKVEGRGNGIKTNIMNMADIARALKRPPEYSTKFCGIELGAQSKFDLAEGKSIVNGAHESRDLQGLIDKYVEKFVLCPYCQLPEIDLVMKKGLVGCQCNACGHSGDLDNVHKLASFMLRNPPKGADSTMGKKKEGLSKATRREIKSSKCKVAPDTVDAQGGGDAAPKPKKKSSKSKNKDGEGECIGERGGSDGGAPAGETSKKPKKSKSGKSKALAGDTILAKESLSYDSPEIMEVKERLLTIVSPTASRPDPDAPANEVAVAQKRTDDDKPSESAAPPTSEGRSLKISPDEFFRELRILQVSQDFDSVMRLFVALDVLLSPDWRPADPEKKILLTMENVQRYIPIFQRLIDRSMDTTKVCAAFEDFIELRCIKPQSMTNLQFVLHRLFLADLVDEEDLIARYAPREVSAEKQSGSSSSKKKKSQVDKHPVHSEAAEAVQPFITWLQEDAEDGTSSEEQEESDSAEGCAQAAQQEASKISGTATTTPAVSPIATLPGPLSQSEDDDLDIDAI